MAINTRYEYELISFTQVSGLVAAFRDRKEDGTYDVYSNPIDAVGVAKFFEVRLLIDESGKVVGKERKENGTGVVALALDGGFFQIEDECENFYGIFKETDNIQEILAC